MGIFKGKKKNYLLVTHEWWMHHKEWKHEFLIGVSRKEAEALASLKAQELTRDFNNCSAHIIEIPETYLKEITKQE